MNEQDFIAINTPDGIVEFPSNMSYEEIESALQKLYPIKKSVVPQDDVMPAPLPNFFQRMGTDLERRGSKTAEIINAYEQQSVPETVLQLGGEAMDLAGDLTSNAAISGYRALPEHLRKSLEGAGGVALGALGRLPSMGGGTLANTLPQEIGMLGEKYGQFSKENPRAARNTEALGSLLSVALPLKPIQAVKNVERAGNIMSKKANNIIKNLNDYSYDALKKESNKLYKKANEYGGLLEERTANKFVSNAFKSATPENVRIQKISKQSPVTDLLVDIKKEYAGRPMSLDDVGALDQYLSKEKQRYFSQIDGAAPEYSEIAAVQRSLRDSVVNAEPKDILGGKEGFDAYQEAVKVYAASKRLEDIEDIINTSSYQQQPARAMLRKFAKLKNSKEYKKYTKKEREIIDKLASESLSADMMKSLTSRLTGIIGIGSGNPLAGTALSAAGVGARNLEQRGMLGQIGKLSKEISDSVVFKKPAPENVYKERFLGNVMKTTGSTLGGLDKMRGRQLTASGLINEQLQEENRSQQ